MAVERLPELLRLIASEPAGQKVKKREMASNLGIIVGVDEAFEKAVELAAIRSINRQKRLRGK